MYTLVVPRKEPHITAPIPKRALLMRLNYVETRIGYYLTQRTLRSLLTDTVQFVHNMPIPSTVTGARGVAPQQIILKFPDIVFKVLWRVM